MGYLCSTNIVEDIVMLKFACRLFLFETPGLTSCIGTSDDKPIRIKNYKEVLYGKFNCP
jgi:hypothetical protein